MTAAEELAVLRGRLAAYARELRAKVSAHDPVTPAGWATLVTVEVVAAEIEAILQPAAAPSVAEPVFAFGEREPAFTGRADGTEEYRTRSVE